jgi:hypothetical protein
VAGRPEPDDYVVATENAEVFLESMVAEALDDKILGADINWSAKVSTCGGRSSKCRIDGRTASGP